MMYKSLVCVMLPFCQLHCGGEGEQGPAGKDGKQGDQGPAGKEGPAGAGGVTEATLAATCKTVADKNDADANKKDLAYAIAKAIIATNANGVADYTEKDNLKAALDSLNPPLAGPRGPAGSITDLGANAKAIAEYTGNAQAEKTEQEGLAKAVANSIKTVVANSDSSTYTVDKDQLATDIITLLTTKFADYQKTATLAADIKAATGADLQNIAEAVTKAIKDIEANGSSIYGGGGTGTKHDLKTALTSLVTVGGTMDAAELATAIDAAKGETDLRNAIADVITAVAADNGAAGGGLNKLGDAVAKAIIDIDTNSGRYTSHTNLKNALKNLVPASGVSLANFGETSKTIAEYTGIATQAEKTEQEGLAKAVANSIKTVVANSDSTTYTVDKDQLAAALKALVDLDNAIDTKITAKLAPAELATVITDLADDSAQRANLVAAIEKLGFTRMYMEPIANKHCKVTGATENTDQYVFHNTVTTAAMCEHFVAGSSPADSADPYPCGTDITSTLCTAR